MARRRKRKLKTWLYFPIALLAVAAATLIFALLTKQGGMAKVENSPSATPSAEIATPTPDITPTPMPAAEHLFAFYDSDQKKWGYKNEAGEILVGPLYSKAQEFSDGLAFVAIDANGELRYSIIDMSGTVVSDTTFDDARPYSEGLAAVKRADSWGYADKSGNAVIAHTFAAAGDFHDGIAKVMRDNKYGYIDANGQEKITPQYAIASDFSADGLAIVGNPDREGVMRYYILDENNQSVSLGRAEGTGFSEGYAALKLEDGKYAFYDKMAKQVFPASGDAYEGALNFSEGLAAVQKDGKWGFIGLDGLDTIPAKYESAKPFAEGLAAVKQDGKWGYVDKNGVKVIDFKYDDASSFKDGYALVRSGDNISVTNNDDTFRKQLYQVDESIMTSSSTAKVKMTGGNLNVRASASTTANIVTKLTNGSTVTVLDIDGEWAKIDYEGLTGYVQRRYLVIDSDADAPTASPTQQPSPSITPEE